MGKGKSKQSIADKIQELDQTFYHEVQALDNAALKDKAFDLMRYSLELEEAKTLDGDLKEKQEAAKEAAKSYTEPLAANKLKRRYILQILKSRASA